jgi:acetyl coenzyme A synthetase (ADP forming)-like protein
MAQIRPFYTPVPVQDATDSGRLILRDGSTASIRIAAANDADSLIGFFQTLPDEARHRRFFSLSIPSAEQIRKLCLSSDAGSSLTLIVTRRLKAELSIIAVASYHKVADGTAEIAFAVQDPFRGKGLGTLLLERLALIAARHGFARFRAVTQADNPAMLDVFRESGFPIRETLEGGYVEVDLSLGQSADSVARSEMRDRIATVASLRPLFRPQAVAVIGASRDPHAVGHRVFEALIRDGFRGPVYPVNPQATDILGRKAFRSIREIPRPVELAVIVVPRAGVSQVIDDCSAVGIKAVIVISAGFAETGPEGQLLQKRLVDQVRGHGMRLLGPNCLGLLNTDPDVRLNASFSPAFPPAGGVAMSSQSGALGVAVLAAARRLQLGLSSFVSVGNKADVSANDLLQYWEEDPRTKVILLYVESFGNPRRFSRIARRVTRRKPIVAVKAGRSRAGSRAASSHTAALAATDFTVDALFQQTGVIRADSLEEMLDIAGALSGQALPPGRRTAILTNAGGPGILCADACEAAGLIVPEFSPELRGRLSSFLPAAASTSNPVDMIASAGASHYAQAIEMLLNSTEVDALIVIYVTAGLAETPQINAAILDGLACARTGAAKMKPVLACVTTEDGERSLLRANSETIPSYAYPENPARVLGKIAGYAAWRSGPAGNLVDFDDLDLLAAHRICKETLAARGPDWLKATEVRQLLRAIRLPLPQGDVARTADEAVRVARAIGYPVAMKLASRQIVHKTEAGGVFLNLADEAAVRRAFDGICQRLNRDDRLNAMDGVSVQEMILGGLEVMIGAVEDPLFGPVLAFGLGGIHVEILGDVVFRVGPLTDQDAHDMIHKIKGYRLLQGYRGDPPADTAALEEILLRLSRLAEEVHEIAEIEFNPVIALTPGNGCRILDCRVRLA